MNEKVFPCMEIKNEMKVNGKGKNFSLRGRVNYKTLFLSFLFMISDAFIYTNLHFLQSFGFTQ